MTDPSLFVATATIKKLAGLLEKVWNSEVGIEQTSFVLVMTERCPGALALTFLACSCKYLIWSAMTVSLLHALALMKSSPWKKRSSYFKPPGSVPTQRCTAATPSALVMPGPPGPEGRPPGWSGRHWPAPAHRGRCCSPPASLGTTSRYVTAVMSRLKHNKRCICSYACCESVRAAGKITLFDCHQ